MKTVENHFHARNHSHIHSFVPGITSASGPLAQQISGSSFSTNVAVLTHELWDII